MICEKEETDSFIFHSVSGSKHYNRKKRKEKTVSIIKMALKNGMALTLSLPRGSPIIMAWLHERRFKKFVHVDVDCRRARG